MIFSHQPGVTGASQDQLYTYAFCGLTKMGGLASIPLDSALIEKGGYGITVYGASGVTDIALFAYSNSQNPNWGIFEWNPMEDSSTTTNAGLQNAYNHGADIICPNSFDTSVHDDWNIYFKPQILQGIREFLAAQPCNYGPYATCDAAHQCVCAYDPCGNKSCCAPGQICFEHRCCSPDCSGRECGPDPACQSSCGSCTLGTCEAGSCKIQDQEEAGESPDSGDAGSEIQASDGSEEGNNLSEEMQEEDLNHSETPESISPDTSTELTGGCGCQAGQRSQLDIHLWWLAASCALRRRPCRKTVAIRRSF